MSLSGHTRERGCVAAGWVILIVTITCFSCGRRNEVPREWQRACAVDGQCGAELYCICGVCTRGCAGDATCQQGSESACYDMTSPLLSERCEALRPNLFVGVCLASCEDDSACTDDAECVQGACVPRAQRSGASSGSASKPHVLPLPDAGEQPRLDASHSAGSGGTQVGRMDTATGAGSDSVVAPPVDAGRPSAPPAVRTPDASLGSDSRCLPPSRVVALGDSYVDIPVNLVGRLERRAVAAGMLAVGEHYRDYSHAGATLDTPIGAGGIPIQWQTAQSDCGEIAWVIMDGGGNDVLSGPAACLEDSAADNPECSALIERVLGVAGTMLRAMKTAGVSHVIYFTYPDVPAGGHALTPTMIAGASALCAELADARFSCEVIDTRPAFSGHPDYFAESIHPSDSGSEALADVLWAALAAHCPGASP